MINKQDSKEEELGQIIKAMVLPGKKPYDAATVMTDAHMVLVELEAGTIADIEGAADIGPVAISEGTSQKLIRKFSAFFLEEEVKYFAFESFVEGYVEWVGRRLVQFV